jgi:hypothetical protein
MLKKNYNITYQMPCEIPFSVLYKFQLVFTQLLNVLLQVNFWTLFSVCLSLHAVGTCNLFHLLVPTFGLCNFAIQLRVDPVAVVFLVRGLVVEGYTSVGSFGATFGLVERGAGFGG